MTAATKQLAASDDSCIERDDIEDQTAFNLAVWQKALSDPVLAGIEFRIETDRYGNYLMAPPPAPEHGEKQSEIAYHLRCLLPRGRVATECPIATSGGVRATDISWMSRERREPQRGLVCLTLAPEICVEVFSPENTRREMREKRTLYFGAGAEEVWFCHRDGRMEFFLKDAPEMAARSALCPAFPARIDLDR